VIWPQIKRDCAFGWREAEPLERLYTLVLRDLNGGLDQAAQNICIVVESLQVHNRVLSEANLRARV
jgi:hypothetical protein